MDLYRDIILDAAKHPHHYGKLEGADVVSRHLNPSCGDEVTVYLVLDGNMVQKIAWEGQGCTLSKAAMSAVSDEVEGKKVGEIAKMTKETVLAMLGLDDVNPGREKCIMIGIDALQKALKEHR